MPQSSRIDRRCSGCGQPRPVLSAGYCLACVGGAHEERRRADALVDYVRDHPGIGVVDASRALGISTYRIAEMIRQGRLVPVEGSRPLAGIGPRAARPMDRP